MWLSRVCRHMTLLAACLHRSGVGVTIICPGPVATGAPGKPRVVFGPAGPITRTELADAKRMAPARAAALVADAMAAGVSEAWLAKQPVLTVGACAIGGAAAVCDSDARGCRMMATNTGAGMHRAC